MKFGVRECCDVVFRAKAPMKVGNKIFYKNEPVIYFDSLKTSTLEGAATTVYAQGGRGNARLMSWDGERTVTFTMEDALISPEGLSILSGAGIIEASEDTPIYVHTTERIPGTEVTGQLSSGTLKNVALTLTETPETTKGAEIYVLVYDDNNNLLCEPFATNTSGAEPTGSALTVENKVVTISEAPIEALKDYQLKDLTFLVDFYVKKTSSSMQINITPDKFGGAFYVEASTLFRDQVTQLDMPAEFIIPNARVQSNFTFTMAGSGDPSTFTFTMDAFPDYTRFNGKEKVLASIQIVGGSAQDELTRPSTNTTDTVDKNGVVIRPDQATTTTTTEPAEG